MKGQGFLSLRWASWLKSNLWEITLLSAHFIGMYSWARITTLLTHSMVQTPSWAANWFAVSQEIPRISRNPKVHYRTHKRPPTVSILGQPNPIHIPTSHLLEIHRNIIHPSTPIPIHSEKYQCRIDTVSSFDDGRIVSWNMYRIWNKYTKNCCTSSWFHLKKRLYGDGRSTKHKNTYNLSVFSVPLLRFLAGSTQIQRSIVASWIKLLGQT